MKPIGKYTPENADLRSYLELVQKIIERLASNSKQMKTWSVSILTLLLAYSLKNDFDNKQTLLLLLPSSLTFCLLDAYYLGIEKGYVEKYVDIIQKVKEYGLIKAVNWDLKPIHNGSYLIKGLRSFSVWGFYVFPLIIVELGLGLLRIF